MGGNQMAQMKTAQAAMYHSATYKIIDPLKREKLDLECGVKIFIQVYNLFFFYIIHQ